MLQCVASCCSALQCVAVCCSVLQYVAVSCSGLLCVTVCCSIVLKLKAKVTGYCIVVSNLANGEEGGGTTHTYTAHTPPRTPHTTLLISHALPIAPPHSGGMQCNTLRHAATRGNIRKHTAVHCNILQHTATYKPHSSIPSQPNHMTDP